jgi:hypothetical protein
MNKVFYFDIPEILMTLRQKNAIIQTRNDLAKAAVWLKSEGCIR